MTKYLSVGKLIELNLLKTGDYINYIPDEATYIATFNNTGWKTEQTFSNDKKLTWRVSYIEDGKVFIVPLENISNNFYLAGSIGFVNGIKELDNICLALASNRKLNTKARSVTIEDINKMNGFIPKETEKRVAFYPEGTIAYGNKKVDGIKYIKEALGFENARFYGYDFGGKHEKDENGILYVVPKKHNPVFVSDTVYYYDFINPLFNEAVWLASSCICLNLHDVFFNIRSSGYGWVSSSVMQSASGCSYFYNYGIKPIVALDANILMEVSEESSDGSAACKAWNLII